MNEKPLTREQLIKETENTYSDLRAALSRFSEEELNKVPFEGSWTAGQVAEHIIKSNGGILYELLNGKTETANRPYDQHAVLMQEIFRNRGAKAKSSPVLAPGEPPHSLDQLLAKLQKHLDRQLKTLSTKDINALSTGLEFPGVGQMTCYEWIYMMIEHTQRHRHQIEDIGAINTTEKQ